MIKLKNPYTQIEGYYCFGCSPHNIHGLQLEFFEDNEYIQVEWKPKHHLQGYFNVLHGGIQATIMDELANWVVNIKLDTAGVTMKMDIRLQKTVNTDKGVIIARGKLKEMKRNIAVIETELFNHHGEVAAKAIIEFYTYTKDIAIEKLRYPGKEAFYN